MTANLKPGDTVKHPARGIGVVSTVVINPINGRVMKAWVEFPFAGTATRKNVCFADDLTVVAAGPVERPALKVVEQPAPSVA